VDDGVFFFVGCVFVDVCGVVCGLGLRPKAQLTNITGSKGALNPLW